MKKLFTFLAALLVTLCVGAQTDLSKGKTWNFESTSEADWSNLKADTENWTINSSDDRASNVFAYADAPLIANGVELEATEGLLFTGGANGKIRIDKNKRLNLNGRDITITIPGLKAGQQITVVAQTSNSNDLTRYLSATNLTTTTGFGEAHAANEQYENTGTVEADGNVTITTNVGGLNIFSITVTSTAAGQVWNFTTTDATDWSNLKADTENWTINSSDDRASNVNAYDNAPLIANGVELKATEGLLFTGGANGKIRIDKDKRLNLNGRDITITIPGLKAGQQITVVAQTSNSNDLTRYLSATNLTSTTGFGEAHAANEQYENTGTVEANGDVTITTNVGGLNIFTITLTEGEGGTEEPEMEAVAYYWDFTTIFSSDVDNLTADETNWKKTLESPDNNPYNRYTAQNAYTAAPLVANNVELDLTKGLTFTAGAKKIRIDEGKRLNLNGKDIVITTPVLKKGQKVKVIAISSSSSEYEDRYLTASNLENTTGFGAGASDYIEYVNTGVVSRDGKVSFTSSGGINIISIEVLGDPFVSIGDTEWATYVVTDNVDFSDQEFTAYKVTEIKSDRIYMQVVTEAAEGDAVVVNGPSGNYPLTKKEDAAAITDNLLVAALEPVVADGTQFVLAFGDNGVGFYRATVDGTIPAGKGYIVVTNSGVNSLSLGDYTGIEGINQVIPVGGAFYNLQGQRVEKPVRGLYIMNGKKVVVK